MATTTLGKRLRSAASTKLSKLDAGRRISPREKLSTLDAADSESENQNPFVIHRQNDEDETDAEEEQRPIKKTRTARSTVPAKHGVVESRVELAPFKVSKPAASAITSTPKTPSRHRDALAKKVQVTPRHRALVGTPRTPRTPSNGASVYNQARQLFARCSNPGKLIGRDEERSQLSNFIKNAIEAKSTGCLYVSGPPGTGKSALLDEVIREHTEDGNIPVSVVNCMSVRNAKDLSQKLEDDLDLKEDAGFEYLRTCFVRGKARDTQNYLVVLDEVDQLVDLDLALLYSLFEWSMAPTSRLILIGIANALDLTDRFLPRLKSRNLKPELLPFMPYSAEQIAEVITSKLKSMSTTETQHVPFLHPAAIQFCAKKVAAQTGDLRKAFDICRRAIDLIDHETRDKDARIQDSPSKTPLMENVNLSSPASPRKPAVYTLETAPKATIAHMARVTAQAFSNGATQRLAGLNLQQKAVLCALAALEKRKRDTQVMRVMTSTPSKSNTSAPSVKQLFEAYSGLCKRENLFHALSSVEFRDVVSGLETLSLVSAVDGKTGSFVLPVTPGRTPGRPKKDGFGGAAIGDESRRVASAVGVKELEAVLEGPGGEMLRLMLEGDGL